MIANHKAGTFKLDLGVPAFVFCGLFYFVGCTSEPFEQKPPIKSGPHLMVHVPNQTVQLGREGEVGEVPFDEQPEYFDNVNDFYITNTAVTNEQYAGFLNEAQLHPDQVVKVLGYKGNSTRPTQIVYTGSRFRPAFGREKFPVATVTYEGARSYCSFRKMRLPTEAEWVAAVRGGTSTLYPWGEESMPNQANWGKVWKGHMPTTEVASFAPNAYGLYDGLGNVWEWTSSSYQPYDGHVEYEHGRNRYVLRGGDWFVEQGSVSVYTRFALEPIVRGLMDGAVGFRCVVDAEQ